MVSQGRELLGKGRRVRCAQAGACRPTPRAGACRPTPQAGACRLTPRAGVKRGGGWQRSRRLCCWCWTVRVPFPPSDHDLLLMSLRIWEQQEANTLSLARATLPASPTVPFLLFGGRPLPFGPPPTPGASPHPLWDSPCRLPLSILCPYSFALRGPGQ